jgi:hypothetical protein
MVFTPTAPAALSLRPLVPSGSLIRCEPAQVYHHHPAFSNWRGKKFHEWSIPLTFMALLCVLSLLSFWRGQTPPQYPDTHFPQSNGNTDYLFVISNPKLSLKVSLTFSLLSSHSCCLLLHPLMPLPAVLSFLRCSCCLTAQSLFHSCFPGASVVSGAPVL